MYALFLALLFALIRAAYRLLTSRDKDFVNKMRDTLDSLYIHMKYLHFVSYCQVGEVVSLKNFEHPGTRE
jgi:hypothetical protein